MEMLLEYEIVQWSNPDGNFANGESANNDRMSAYTEEEMAKLQEFFAHVKSEGILINTTYHWNNETKILYIVRHADIEKYREKVENLQVPKKTSRDQWQGSPWIFVSSTIEDNPPTF